jgi:hypothetical protein
MPLVNEPKAYFCRKVIMKKQALQALFLSLISLTACVSQPIEESKVPTQDQSEEPTGSNYSIEQAISDKAQLSTIAFSGLAFITGSLGADTFIPPGKVADFFGFQYMRDIDVAGYGHNTQFLSRIANNVLAILNDDQRRQLIELAILQAPLYVKFAYNRYPMIEAFVRNLEQDLPVGSLGLDIDAVGDYTSRLYQIDAQLSYERAVTVGSIIASFTQDQIDQFSDMAFNDFNTWPDVAEDQDLKKNLTNTEFVAVMTYASELFSWYKGSIDADIYFCPERHGTYFGGFYMKDYPAMNNPDYFISTSITGDSGQAFLDILTTQQRALIIGIIDEQKDEMTEIVSIRTQVATELRKAMVGGTVDKDKVFTLIERYGDLDGQLSALYAIRFAQVKATLTDEQMIKLIALRNLDIVPQGAYLFSTAIDMPEMAETDYFFGIGTMPDLAGMMPVPAGFSDPTQPKDKPAQ